MSLRHVFGLLSVLLFSAVACQQASETAVRRVSAAAPQTNAQKNMQPVDYSEALRLLLLRRDTLLPTPQKSLADSLLHDFYAKRNFQTLWNSVEKIDEAVKVLLSADEHGLTARDYGLDYILELKRAAVREEYQNPQSLAALEVALTAGLLQYAVHVLGGKLTPTEVHPLWNYPSRDWVKKNQTNLLEKYVASDSTARIFSNLRRHPHYVFLKNQLALYRKMAAEEVFQPIRCDTVVHKGGSHRAIVRLRKRLRAEKIYLNASDTAVLDDSLSEALKIWQYRHGLKQTGILDTATCNALNVPAERHIATIRANMERMRWLPDTLLADFILVNIPDFRLFLFRNGKPVWETPVTVGTRVNQTPVFQTYISHLELNPVWNVPQSIITKEIALEAARKSNYIAKNNFKIIDKNGNQVDPAAVNWANVRNRKTVYHIYQPPGPGNQLGRIKFYCVNPHAIYLHDTPNLNKFRFQERAFSHGCVRVWNPFALAGRLMGDTLKWNQAAFDRLLESAATRNVMLPCRETVHLHYFTAFPDRQGRLVLRRDVYGHDRRLLAALDAPPASWQ